MRTSRGAAGVSVWRLVLFSLKSLLGTPPCLFPQCFAAARGWNTSNSFKRLSKLPNRLGLAVAKISLFAGTVLGSVALLTKGMRTPGCAFFLVHADSWYSVKDVCTESRAVEELGASGVRDRGAGLPPVAGSRPCCSYSPEFALHWKGDHHLGLVSVPVFLLD